jgi:hypothetical protein
VTEWFTAGQPGALEDLRTNLRRGQVRSLLISPSQLAEEEYTVPLERADIDPYADQVMILRREDER